MADREMPTLTSVRAERQRIAGDEAWIQGEYRDYKHLREAALTALNLAGGDSSISAPDHASIVERRGVLLVSEIGRTTDPKEKHKLAEQLRSLADQVEDRRFDVAKEASERINAQNINLAGIELWLLELREERRRYIEALRQTIDVASSQELILECCALIEEDIHSSLAAGDVDGVRRSSASLAAVRALIQQKEEEKHPEDALAEHAHYLAASIVGDRSYGISAGDAGWFERVVLANLSKLSGPNRDRDAVRAALGEYREVNRRGPALRASADVDPKGALVHGKV